MTEFRVTFGQQFPLERHPRFPEAHHDGWVAIQAADEDEARELAFEYLGQRWAFIYGPDDPSYPDDELYPLGELGVLVARDARSRFADELFGPQGEQVAALIERVGHLSGGDIDALVKACDTGWSAPWSPGLDYQAAIDAARSAAWVAAGDLCHEAVADAVGGAGRHAEAPMIRNAVRNAVVGLLVRDLISAERYDVLTLPWRTAIGPIHPDDEEISNG